MNSIEKRSSNSGNNRKHNQYANYKNKKSFSNYEYRKNNNVKNKSFNYSKNSPRIREKSCGCIIINDGKVLLIQQKKGNWGFPKGHVEFNETEKQTAIREVKEETNLDVKIFNNRRYTEKYISYKGRMKQVVYFLAKQTGGIEKKQDSEIRAMKWMEFDDAIKKLTYSNTRNLFGKVLRDLK